jgi:hypothetical protein
VNGASASASCAAGHTLLSGGGRLTTTDTPDTVMLVATYPSATDTWTVTGAGNVKNGKTWSIQAFVVCSA